jgi:hypothetical protein
MMPKSQIEKSHIDSNNLPSVQDEGSPVENRPQEQCTKHLFLSNINTTLLAASTPSILQLQATLICNKPNLEKSNVVTPKVEEKSKQKIEPAHLWDIPSNMLKVATPARLYSTVGLAPVSRRFLPMLETMLTQ